MLWNVNHRVKRGTCLRFWLRRLIDISIDEDFRYFDEETYPMKKLRVNDNVRATSGGIEEGLR